MYQIKMNAVSLGREMVPYVQDARKWSLHRTMPVMPRMIVDDPNILIRSPRL